MKVLLCWFIASATALAATTWDVPSPLTNAGLNSVIAGVAAGDTVRVPAETLHVTTTITVDVPITLISVGTTVLIDDKSGNTPFLTLRILDGLTTRCSGFTFQNGTHSGQNVQGCVQVYSTDTLNTGRIRIDHCTFDHLAGFGVYFYGGYGVIDHCDFGFSGTNIPIYVFGRGPYGDTESSAATNFGGDDFLFVEDCTASYDNPATSYAFTDSFRGGRYVVRHCAITRCFLSMHGTESGQRNRGTRAVEAYNNTFAGPLASGVMVDVRSGVVLIHDNTATGVGQTGVIHLLCDRLQSAFSPWQFADGRNAWDVNLAGGPFYSGTATSAGTRTVTVSGASWTTDQWVGYSLRNVTVDDSAYISGNTSTTITYKDKAGFGSDMVCTAGDSLEIYKVTYALDQPGRVRGSLITGDTPSPPGGWNDQVNEKCYEWNNTTDGANMPFAVSHAQIAENVHFASDTAMPGYTPYAYPHPLNTSASVGTTTVSGSGHTTSSGSGTTTIAQ